MLFLLQNCRFPISVGWGFHASMTFPVTLCKNMGTTCFFLPPPHQIRFNKSASRRSCPCFFHLERFFQNINEENIASGLKQIFHWWSWKCMMSILVEISSNSVYFFYPPCIFLPLLLKNWTLQHPCTTLRIQRRNTSDSLFIYHHNPKL